MKLYYFNPHDWDSAYSVMADSKESALDFLKKYLKKEHKYIYNLWSYCDIYTLPEGYTIDEFEEGKINETEIS